MTEEELRFTIKGPKNQNLGRRELYPFLRFLTGGRMKMLIRVEQYVSTAALQQLPRSCEDLKTLLRR